MSRQSDYYSRIKRGLCVECGKRTPAKNRRRCQKCLGRAQKTDRNIRMTRRKQIFDAYGAICVCCGITDDRFLTIDHVNNDGNLERRTYSNKGMYKKIIEEFFSQAYQILCFNCNCGRAKNGGVCPHKDPLPELNVVGQVEVIEVH